MEIVEIKPNNHINFRIPNCLHQKFVISNLTLRSVCVYILALHPEAVTVEPEAQMIDAFQEL